MTTSGWLEVRTTDYHTAGEPFRIVTSGVPDIPGATVRDRRELARRSDEVDQVRGLDITITTTAQSDDEAFALLEALGMPFSKEGRPEAAVS